MLETNIEIRSGTLTPVQLESEIDTIVAFFQAEGQNNLIVSFGFGCDLDQDELYQDKSLLLSGLRDFITQSRQSNIFTLGEADLHINNADNTVEFVLCHESDIHMIGSRTLANKVGSEWGNKGYSYYERDTHEWIEVTPTGRF